MGWTREADEYLETRRFVSRIIVEQRFFQCEDPELLSPFQQEKAKLGMAAKDVSLLLPEDPYYNPRGILPTLGEVNGDKRSGYRVILYPYVITCDPFSSYKSVIRHELRHIRNGDLDRRFPQPFQWLYDVFVKEIRAAGWF